jgi:hypothetical protein
LGTADGGVSGVTAQGNATLFTNVNWIFEFLNYVDAGSDGGGIDLKNTTVTMPPTLIAPDRVESKGNFTVGNRQIDWDAQTYLNSGVPTIFNQVTFSSSAPLGNLRFISYLDEDIFNFTDDLMWLSGTPGQPDFRAYTLDGPERVGFSHGGFYQTGPLMTNAIYDGWAADEFADLRTAIGGAGTTYSVAGNIDLTSLPAIADPQLGTVYGPDDVTTAFAWTVDATATTATITSFLDLVPQNPGIQGGSWRGLQLQPSSAGGGTGAGGSDRNLEAAVEGETGLATATDVNPTPNQAQYLGALAPNEKSGDDNLRLGFQAYASLSRPSDVDVYSFSGSGGSEVWLDLDRTASALDSVIELVDGNGATLARSDNSGAEAADPSRLFHAADIVANPLSKSPTLIPDRWTSNPKDAGLRVVLPGPQGSQGTYFVRVRSSSSNLDDLAGGRTAGAYQLQVRLRELDEFPGSTIQGADIRYATRGIDIIGGVSHSPLTGEASETLNAGGADANNTLGTAEALGNLLTTDRGTLGVAGAVAAAADVDWYQFEVR